MPFEAIPAWEWRATRVRFPAPVAAPTPYYPDVILFMDGTGRLLAQHLLRPEEPSGSVAATFRDAIRESGAPPSRIITDHKELAQALRALVPDVEVKVGATPEFLPVLDHLEGFLESKLRTPRFIEHPSVTPQMVQLFLDAAARFHALGPTESVSSEQVIRMDVPELDVKDAVVSVARDPDEDVSLIILPSMEALLLTAEVAEETAGLAPPPTDTFMVGYLSKDEVHDAIKEEITQHGLKVSRPCPFIINMVDEARQVLTSKDYQLATACLTALTRFIQEHGQVFSDDTTESSQARYTVETPERVHVTLRTSLEDWMVAGEALWGEEEEDLEEFPEGALYGQILDGFAHHLRRLRRGEPWLNAAMTSIEGFLVFLTRVRSVELWQTKAADVDEFLLEFFPAYVAAEENVVRAVPEALTLFFQWLRSVDEMDPRKSASLVKAVARHEAAFKRRAHDPRTFSEGKALVETARLIRDESARRMRPRGPSKKAKPTGKPARAAARKGTRRTKRKT
ncbi:MAG: hypothetical protein AB2A00_24180 [Myxococcota bacterium]